MKDNSIDKARQLTDKQQKILSAYVDGEATWWHSFIIGKSLQKNFEVRQYVDSLERNAQSFKNQYITETAEKSNQASLTDRVISRISQEERLSLLRSLPSGYSNSETFLGRLFDHDWFGINQAVREKLAWGSMGAVCASLFILFLLPSFLNSNNLKQVNLSQSAVLNTSGQKLAFNNSDNSHLVAFNNADSSQNNFSNPGNFDNQQIRYYALSGSNANLLNRYQKQPYEELQTNRYSPETSLYLRKKYIAPQVVEVDWVRSAGRVKVLKDPNGRASILWVQKKRNTGLADNIQINSALRGYNNKATGPAVEFVSNK